MDATRRYRAAAATGGLLAALGAVAARPVLLAGAAAVAAWLVAAQYAVVSALGRVGDDLDVTQATDREAAQVEEPVAATLSARLPAPSGLALSVTGQPPAAAAAGDRADRTATLAPGDETASTTFAVRPRVAGRLAFGRPLVRARDPLGLFAETVRRGQAPTLRVEPRRPRTLHLGAGGDRVAGAYGEHPAERAGGGLEPAEIRAYAPGDPASRIDWKATARLGDPHVREFEAETDRRTDILLDHRAALAAGPPGETAFEYLREVALAVAGAARSLSDPLALYAVGDEGTTARITADAGERHYRTVEDRIRALEPTAGPNAARRPGDPDPAAARRAADRLAGGGSAYAQALGPLLASADPYVERMAREPLFGTARARVARGRGRRWTVVLTGDDRRAETRETLKLLRRGDDHVLAVLAPAVLFEPGSLADLESAYDRYRDFEAFRRDLDALDRVTALEVGPGDRLDALLAGRRRARGGG